DSNPTGDTPLEIRMKHFTEVENFTFLAYVLGHELGGTAPRPIRTVTDLEVPDDEFQNFVNTAKTVSVTDEELADSVLDDGIIGFLSSSFLCSKGPLSSVPCLFP